MPEQNVADGEAPDEVTELSALYEISTIPTSLVSMEDLASLGLDKATRLLRTRLALLYRWEGCGDGAPSLWATRGMPARQAARALPDLAAVAEAFELGRPLTLDGPDRCRDLALIPDGYGARHALLAPCGRVGGGRALLVAFRLADLPFGHRDLALFGVLADRIGAALETLRLFDEMAHRQEDLQHEIVERQQAQAERERLIAELRESLAAVRTLTGLLPICAWCKRIRTDEGYWAALEEYLKEHTDAVLTHSICPECARELNKEFTGEQ